MYSNNYTLFFVFIVTVVLGTMLSFTKDSVKDLQDQNLKADVQKTILRSLNFDESLLLSNESIEETFKNSIDAKCVNVEGEIVECNIEEVDIEKNVETLPIYIRIDNDKVVASMIDTHNKKHTSTRAILDKVAFPFYESLYKNKSHEHTQSDRQEGVRVCLDSINKFIPTSLHATLEADIKEGEITRAINKLAWHKAPGCDGLSINYYKLFQKQLSKPLEEMYRDSLKQNALPPPYNRPITVHSSQLLITPSRTYTFSYPLSTFSSY